MKLIKSIVLLVVCLFLLPLSCKKDDDNSGNDAPVSDLLIASDVTKVTIEGGNDGKIDITVTGGKTPYRYIWSNGATTEDLTGLSPRFYTVTVTDAKSKTATSSSIVTNPAMDATCGCDGQMTLSDERDGKTYKIGKIGNQCWMTENLNIGTLVTRDPYYPATEQTNNDTIEKYCAANEGGNCDLYGGLYEWGEMLQYDSTELNSGGTVQGLCPAGWHIPSEDEWVQLIDYLGGIEGSGAKMKETGTEHWYCNGCIYPTSLNATNESGFNALGSGFKTDLTVTLPGDRAIWWCIPSDYNYYNVGLYHNTDNVYFQNGYQGLGFSIRCLRDY